MDGIDAYIAQHGMDLPADPAARQLAPEPPGLHEPTRELNLREMPAADFVRQVADTVAPKAEQLGVTVWTEQQLLDMLAEQAGEQADASDLESRLKAADKFYNACSQESVSPSPMIGRGWPDSRPVSATSSRKV